MALKDWKMIRDFGRFNMREYRNQKKIKQNIINDVIIQRTDTGDWFAYGVEENLNNGKDKNLFHKKVKTKQQALAFAKQYMRTH